MFNFPIPTFFDTVLLDLFIDLKGKSCADEVTETIQTESKESMIRKLVFTLWGIKLNETQINITVALIQVALLGIFSNLLRSSSVLFRRDAADFLTSL